MALVVAAGKCHPHARRSRYSGKIIDCLRTYSHRCAAKRRSQCMFQGVNAHGPLERCRQSRCDRCNLDSVWVNCLCDAFWQPLACTFRDRWNVCGPGRCLSLLLRADMVAGRGFIWQRWQRPTCKHAICRLGVHVASTGHCLAALVSAALAVDTETMMGTECAVVNINSMVKILTD